MSPTLYKTIATGAVCLTALLAAAGCASTEVSHRQSNIGANEKLPRPAQIFVYDFAATTADVPSDSAMAREFALHAAPQTAEQIAAGRQLGAQIASELAAQIRGLGMPATRAVKGATPRVNDLVIRGYLVSIDEGSATKRIAIGFGSGGSELRTAVEGLQMTARGLRKLGSGAVDSGGSKTPGAAVGAATFIATANPAGLIVSSGMKVYGEASGRSRVEGRATATAKEIADVLKRRFQEQGWID
jgi:hypothetical protein